MVRFIVQNLKSGFVPLSNDFHQHDAAIILFQHKTYESGHKCLEISWCKIDRKMQHSVRSICRHSGKQRVPKEMSLIFWSTGVRVTGLGGGTKEAIWGCSMPEERDILIILPFSGAHTLWYETHFDVNTQRTECGKWTCFPMFPPTHFMAAAVMPHVHSGGFINNLQALRTRNSGSPHLRVRSTLAKASCNWDRITFLVLNYWLMSPFLLHVWTQPSNVNQQSKIHGINVSPHPIFYLFTTFSQKNKIK